MEHAHTPTLVKSGLRQKAELRNSALARRKGRRYLLEQILLPDLVLRGNLRPLRSVINARYDHTLADSSLNGDAHQPYWLCKPASLRSLMLHSTRTSRP